MELSKSEFHAYLLLYSIEADQEVNQTEREFIRENIAPETYAKVKRLIDDENDYERIQRILHYLEAHEYDHEDPNVLIEEIKEAMRVDGDFDSAELAVLVGLRKLLKTVAKNKS